MTGKQLPKDHQDGSPSTACDEPSHRAKAPLAGSRPAAHSAAAQHGPDPGWTGSRDESGATGSQADRPGAGEQRQNGDGRARKQWHTLGSQAPICDNRVAKLPHVITFL